MQWPVILNVLHSICLEVPQFYQNKRLCAHYGATISSGEIKVQPSLTTAVMCVAQTLKAGGPIHFSDVRGMILKQYGVALSDHSVLATLGRMEEVTICDTGMYVHYANLSFSEEDLIQIRDSVATCLENEGCFVSSKVLFERLHDKLQHFDDLNHYLILGIAQDDERFVTKRGNMVGLIDFNIEETFISLEDEVCDLVRDHGPISILDIVDRMSATRKLCNDSGVRLILSGQPWIVEVGYRKYDVIDRLFSDKEEMQRYILAIKISLLGGVKSKFAISEDLRAVGLSKATPEVVGSLLANVDHVAEKSLVRLVSMDVELGTYATLAGVALGKKGHAGTLSSASPSYAAEWMEELSSLDSRFLPFKNSNPQAAEHTELRAILDEFNF